MWWEEMVNKNLLSIRWPRHTAYTFGHMPPSCTAYVPSPPNTVMMSPNIHPKGQNTIVQTGVKSMELTSRNLYYNPASIATNLAKLQSHLMKGIAQAIYPYFAMDSLQAYFSLLANKIIRHFTSLAGKGQRNVPRVTCPSHAAVRPSYVRLRK